MGLVNSSCGYGVTLQGVLMGCLGVCLRAFSSGCCIAVKDMDPECTLWANRGLPLNLNDTNPAVQGQTNTVLIAVPYIAQALFLQERGPQARQQF